MRQQLARGDWNERLPPTCGTCGYNLTASFGENRQLEGRCPECGAPFLRVELVKRAKDAWARLQAVDYANDLIRTGWYAAGGAVGFLILFTLVGAPGLGRAVGLLLGAATVAAGTQIYRVVQVPRWAREFLTVRPDYLTAATMILLGLAIIVVAVFQRQLTDWVSTWS